MTSLVYTHPHCYIPSKKKSTVERDPERVCGLYIVSKCRGGGKKKKEKKSSTRYHRALRWDIRQTWVQNYGTSSQVTKTFH